MNQRIAVLLVEDNPADAAFVRALLEPTPFELTVVDRLSKALQSVNEREFDIAVLDMSLPDARGIEALRSLQHARSDMPVVILSGQDDEVLARDAVSNGAQDYLLKHTVTEGALRRSLSYAIERGRLGKRISLSVSELESQRASVLELNQLKNDLIATLAHDIKGPLTSITGFAELLEDGLLEGAEAIDAARTIRTNAQRLANLANDVLALSRVEHGELEIADDRVELREVLNDVAALYADRAIEISGGEGAYVRGDAARLRQVFDNLIRNAIKYDRSQGPIAVAVREAGDAYAVSVTDRGIGIPPEEIPKLFERFARASNAKRAKISGTGLGLFISRMIVERHGGTVSVESRVDEGSTFTVTLPAFETAILSAPPRVTIVTPDGVLSRFIAYELRARGFRVRELRGTDEMMTLGDVRPGEIVLADGRALTSGEIRPLVAGAKLVVLGSDGQGSGEGYDAALPLPFLLNDLLKELQRVPPPAKAKQA